MHFLHKSANKSPVLSAFPQWPFPPFGRPQDWAPVLATCLLEPDLCLVSRCRVSLPEASLQELVVSIPALNRGLIPGSSHDESHDHLHVWVDIETREQARKPGGRIL